MVKAKRIFCVVAYDIKNDRCRAKVSKLLEKYGVRVNYSVFECLFTVQQLEETQAKTEKLIDKKEDSLVYYTVCVDCYTKTIYQPKRKIAHEITRIF